MPGERREDELPEGYRQAGPVPYTGNPSYWQPPGNPQAPAPGGAPPPYPFQYNPSPPPPMPGVPTAAPVPRRSRRGPWIALIVLAVLLLAAIPTFFVVRYVTRSTPDRTLDTFCAALQQQDYQAAFDQFSTTLQRSFPEAALASALSQDKVVACTHGTTGDSGNSVTNSLQLVHASKGVNDDVVTLVKDSNDDWKIDDIYKKT